MQRRESVESWWVENSTLKKLKNFPFRAYCLKIKVVRQDFPLSRNILIYKLSIIHEYYRFLKSFCAIRPDICSLAWNHCSFRPTYSSLIHFFQYAGQYSNWGKTLTLSIYAFTDTKMYLLIIRDLFFYYIFK